MAQDQMMEDVPVEDERTAGQVGRRRVLVLLCSVGIAASCAIVYELIIAAMSAYLLGNSVYYFSITIGLFMSSMGLGSFLSKYFVRNLIDRFIQVEIAIGLLGGISTAVLMWVYVRWGNTSPYFAAMFGLIIGIGTCVGLEIPILTRIMKQYGSLRVTIANVLAFDYVGALLGSVAFPLFLLKELGLVQTAFVVGFLNVVVGVVLMLEYWRVLAQRALLLFSVVLIGGGLLAASLTSGQISGVLEAGLYDAQVIHSQQSKYQRIVLSRVGDTWDRPGDAPKERVAVAKRRNDLRLFIDGQIQFSSVDEYRYHEALVHPAMGLAADRGKILILGGGDGLATREVLKYPDVESVLLVDLDPEIIRVCSTHPEIVALNEDSLRHPKVAITNQDAYKFLEKSQETFDVVLIDLPDPQHESLSKLYTVEFYKLVTRVLSSGGIVVTQSTSPYFARAAFWSIHRSMEEAGLHTLAYHIDVPALGDWGFNLASQEPITSENIPLNVETLYLTEGSTAAMFQFGRDVSEIDVRINTLLRPILIDYYNDERWAYY